MMDFHSHILPEMDDGSRSPEMSRDMLEMMTEQKIDAVIATPHFYADNEAPEEFLRRRAEAVKRLGAILRPGMPRVLLGAEVAFFTGISRSPQIESLCVLGTKILLVEMPFDRWSEPVISELFMLRSRRGLIPVVAHIERYMEDQPRGIENRLTEQGILLQSNAAAFLERRSARHALRMFQRKQVLLLGSDAHNTTTRAPNLGEAVALLEEKAPKAFVCACRFSEILLRGAQPVSGGN